MACKLLLLLALLLGTAYAVPLENVAPQFAAGAGTAENPYVINTCTELQQAGMSPSADFILGQDIDCSETRGWNGGDGFIPIGTFSYRFIGAFNGNGFTVTELFIRLPGENQVGLFGYIGTEASVYNLSIADADITGNQQVGMLAGHTTSTTITSCSVQGVVSGTYMVGGLIGQVSTQTVLTDCHAAGAVFGGSEHTGGLVGYLYAFEHYIEIVSCSANVDVVAQRYSGGLIGNLHSSVTEVTDSYALGSTTGTTDVGGLVGYAAGSGASPLIMRSFALGSVNASGDNVGGLVGRQGGGSITDCYAHADILSAYAYGGGLVGRQQYGEISRTYSTGKIAGQTYLGGLIGFSESSVDGSYWDTEASGYPFSDGGTGRTTAQMMDPETFSGWDFQNIWDMTPGETYPELR